MNTVLTRRERNILILCAENIDCKHLSNTEIAQRLGITVSNLKTTIHRICIKLGARSRNEAIMNALKQGIIGLNELCTIDEIVTLFSPLGARMFRRLAYLIRHGVEHDFLHEYHELNTNMNIKSYDNDDILTKTERDVLALVNHGLTNREIADRLCMSMSSVRTFLYRSYTKLGVCKRSDAGFLAAKHGEVPPWYVFTPHDLLQMFTPLGADTVEEIAQLMDEKIRQEIVLTYN